VAQWLSDHPKIKAVYHPALPSCPGHDLWKRDFSGSTSVFSILFDDSIAPAQIDNFIDGLALFHIGLSWGGVNSLAVVYPDIDRPGQDYGGRLVRLNIGLEHVEDLIADLENAFRIAL
jgi:cystathionine beta-lyase